MRAVIVHQQADVRSLRRALLGAGYRCDPGDCVGVGELPVRLAQGVIDLVAVKIDRPDAMEADDLKQSWALTTAPKLAIGRTGDRQVVEMAEELGVVELVDAENLERQLDETFDRLRSRGFHLSRRGYVASVFAPLPGSGGATVAVNLAAALAQKQQHPVGLLEFSRHGGKLALMLDLAPMHTAAAVCQRWQELDQASLRSSLMEHASGLRVMTNGVDAPGNLAFDCNSARRVAILSRVAHSFTIAALDSVLSDEALEVMRLSDLVAMVVRPDVPAVRRAQWACERLQEAGVAIGRIRLIVNRKGQRGELPLDRIESCLGLKAIESIPDDPALVNRAANDGKLLRELGNSKITKRFDALATLLLREATATG